MKNPDDPRHAARIVALQQLFLENYSESEGTPTEDFEISDYLSVDELEGLDEELYRSLLDGIHASTDQTFEIISKYAPQWPIEQIKKVDLQILRIAIFEGFIGKLTPPKVAIDEAIELAKEFGGQASDKFVNGVLGALYEEHKGKRSN
ncbi:transcription antitermination factor NusB [Candidatus Nomurabacteria bacterium]|uniref:Transcription antitermination protein NusB n=1 Tax=Candidatus Dojkabacteria bacterium TaxID=2099670 RepID=A0A955KXG3_9BACT|nr:transcription antitermination factor NusB [Candidatus Dojkabacteria bacterium]MCB9789875.1 transcription antitermination factor NusB [Candidatus Nomurabacteria bacterium]MCB9803501.1 transcription antitermination factor NusB [Candidatus Nomurabacteria bacterium]